MHGVHPAANAIPSGKAPVLPGRARSNSGRRSANSAIGPRPSA